MKAKRCKKCGRPIMFQDNRDYCVPCAASIPLSIITTPPPPKLTTCAECKVDFDLNQNPNHMLFENKIYCESCSKKIINKLQPKEVTALVIWRDPAIMNAAINPTVIDKPKDVEKLEKIQKEIKRKKSIISTCHKCNIEFDFEVDPNHVMFNGKIYCEKCFQEITDKSKLYAIRVANKTDVNELCECCQIWTERPQSKRKRILRESFRNPNFFVIIAIFEGHVVGFMGWRLIHGWVTTFDRLISNGIFIIPKHRNIGLLHKMWEKTLETCKFELCLIDTIMGYPSFLNFKKSGMSIWYFNGENIDSEVGE